jgi:hypothetical protein
MRRLVTVPVVKLALLLLVTGAQLWWVSPLGASKDQPISGTYSDEQLAGVGQLTLPRMFLYARTGALIPQDNWPAELRGFKKHAGDAFCCVSEAPAPPDGSGPPPDCKVIVYGTDVRENFKGLRSASGQALTYESLPKRKYLLVEYYAAWCQPCVSGRKALETFFRTVPQARDYLWVSIDMSRLPEAQEAAKRSKQKGR